MALMTADWNPLGRDAYYRLETLFKMQGLFKNARADWLILR